MDIEKARREANFTRYRNGQVSGHYESFFARANHPDRPFAFWIRYTIFSPSLHPEKAIGEIWAIYFNGETGVHAAVKSEIPFNRCTFANNAFSVKAGASIIGPDGLSGRIKSPAHEIRWDLATSGGEEPLFDFPLRYYDSGFPKAKALVARPMALFNGTIRVDGKTLRISKWTGSQNHNWGSRHTDHYAWGQVAGFDNSPGTFLEVSTGRIKAGPFWTPFMTPIVLRHHGREYTLNNLLTSFGRASFSYFSWNFKARSPEVRMEGHIHAERNDFVCLPYYNPPGGIKHCLNTKIASCRLMLWPKGSAEPETLEARRRAAFEILTDKNDHGMQPDI